MIGGHEYEDTPYLTEAVRGANLLSRNCLGWYRSKANLGTLRMNDPETCILAQCYGGYYRGTEALQESMGVLAPYHFGFNVHHDQSADYVAWDQLRAAWVRVIAELVHAHSDLSQHGMWPFLAHNGALHIVSTEGYCLNPCAGTTRHDVIE